MTKEKSTPAPLETGPGEQMDDNIDDFGHKTGTQKQEQPVDPKKPVPSDKNNYPKTLRAPRPNAKRPHMPV